MSLFDLLGGERDIPFAGRDFKVSVLSFGDLADIEEVWGIDFFNQIDTEGVKVIQAVMWDVLRKNDKRLTKEQKENETYILTKREAQKNLPITLLLSPAGQEFTDKVMKACGVKSEGLEEGTEPAGNETAGSD